MHRYIQWCSDSFSFYKSQETFIHIAGLVLISIFVFSNSLSSYFLQIDDLGPAYHRFPASFLDIFMQNTYGGQGSGNYRPLEVLPHMLETYLYGHNSPFGRHLTNLIIHICNVILVNRIAFYLTGIKVIGFMAGLLFAVSSVHSQSVPPVAWISGRTELFVTVFYLLTVLLFMKAVYKGSHLAYLSSLVTFSLALLSKEMAITLPFVILLYLLLFASPFYGRTNGVLRANHAPLIYRTLFIAGIVSIMLGLIGNPYVTAQYLSSDGILDEYTVRNIHILQIIALFGGGSIMLYVILLRCLREPSRLYRCVSYALPYFLIACLYLILRAFVLEGLGGYYKSGIGNVFLQVGLDAFMRDIFGLGGLIWPIGFSYNFDVFTLQIEHTGTFYMVSILATVALMGVLLWSFHCSRVLTFSFLWIFMTLIPVHNIVLPSWIFQARYLYLPSVGFCLFISVLVYKLAGSGNSVSRWRRSVVIACFVSVIILNAVFIIDHNEVLSHSGEIVRELVAGIQRHEADIAPKANLFFLTFPLSSIDTRHTVWITEYMKEVLYFANLLSGYRKRNSYEFLLFVEGGENGQVNMTWQDARVFILDGSGYTNYFVMPKERSSREKEIEAIYMVLTPHVMLQPLPPVGGIEETNNAFITVLDVDDNLKTIKLRVELKDPSHKRVMERVVIYANGHFELV